MKPQTTDDVFDLTYSYDTVHIRVSGSSCVLAE
jgi:hypothetical protein